VLVFLALRNQLQQKRKSTTMSTQPQQQQPTFAEDLLIETPSETTVNPAETVSTDGGFNQAQFAILHFIKGFTSLSCMSLVKDHTFKSHMSVLENNSLYIDINAIRQQQGEVPVTFNGRVVYLPSMSSEKDIALASIKEEDSPWESDEAFVPDNRPQGVYALISASAMNGEKSYEIRLFVESVETGAEQFKPVQIPVVVFHYGDNTLSIEPGVSWDVSVDAKNRSVRTFIQDCMYTVFNSGVNRFGTTKTTYASQKERQETTRSRSSNNQPNNRRAAAAVVGQPLVGVSTPPPPFHDQV
jgi:hypothetical protein